MKVESLLQYLPTLTGIDGIRVMTFLVYNSFYTVEFWIEHISILKFLAKETLFFKQNEFDALQK